MVRGKPAYRKLPCVLFFDSEVECGKADVGVWKGIIGPENEPVCIPGSGGYGIVVELGRPASADDLTGWHVGRGGAGRQFPGHLSNGQFSPGFFDDLLAV